LLALLAFAAASLVLAGVHYCCSHVLAHTIFLGDHIKGIFAAASLVLAGTIELSNYADFYKIGSSLLLSVLHFWDPIVTVEWKQ
jgi:hypothetical protein